MEHEKIRLRAAQVDDIPLLTHWDEQPHVIESDPNDDWNWESGLARDPEWREQLVAEADGVPIGFVQIIDPAREDSHYWGECPPNLRAIDIWIGEASYIGRGFGTRARRFYEKIGFTFVDIRRFGEDVCAVYRLDREVVEGDL